jgi:hypothetical protein
MHEMVDPELNGLQSNAAEQQIVYSFSMKKINHKQSQSYVARCFPSIGMGILNCLSTVSIKKIDSYEERPNS